MASKINTDVNINVKSSGGTRAAKDVNAAQQALKKLGATAQDADKGAVRLNRSTTRLGQASASSGRQFSAQAAGLGGLVGAYAGAAATIFALQQAFSALNRAAQVEQLVAGTNTLAAKVGENGSKIIKSLQEITEGQLTLADASEKANLALSSGFSTKQIEELGRVATKVSKALGRNLGDSFERLVRGATKLEPELLDELGIFTKIDPATRKYAQSIGKAVTELSEFERRQAFVNSIIEEGTRKFNDLDTSAPNAQKSLNTLSVTLQNLGTQFGILLSNYLAPVADFFANSLSGAISIFGLVATQISSTAFTQLIQGSEALSSKFEEQRLAFLNGAKQTEKSRKALTDFNQTMMATPRLTTVFRGGDAIENTAKQLFALGQAGKISAANINDFQEAMVNQAKLATESANKYQAAQDKILAKQAKGAISRAEQRALADYTLLLSNAQRDQLRFAQAASIATGAVKAQSATLTIGAKAWRAFGAAISFAGKAASVAFRAFNIFLVALSIGPLILELVGKIEIFNKAMEKLKDMFLATKNASEDIALGMSALANSLDSGAVISKYEDIGIAAKNSQKIQLEALEDLSEQLKSRDPFEKMFASGEKGAKKATVAVGVTTGALGALGIAALGLAGTLSLPFVAVGAAVGATTVAIDELIASTLGTEPVLRGLITGIVGWFGAAETEAEATTRVVTSLQETIENLTKEFAETGNRDLLVLIDTYSLFIDKINSATIAQQQFIGSIARLTGQNANLIQSLLGDSFTDIGPVLDGVQIGIKGVGNSIEQLTGVAAQGVDTFIGFQAVLLQTEKANNSGATSAKEYIDQIQALRTAQANLGNTLQQNERRIETTKNIIRDLNNTIANTTDEEVIEGLTLRVVELQDELEILEDNTDAMSASFDKNKDKVNELTSAYDLLNKQVARSEAIVKAFDSAARSVSDFDLTGIINPNSGAIAANSTEVLANKIAVLRKELESISGLENNLKLLQDQLISTADTAEIAQLTNQINTLKKQIADSDSRRDFLNKAIAGTQLSQIQNLAVMNKQLDDMLVKQAQQNTLRSMQNNIKLMQTREDGLKQSFAIEKKLMGLAHEGNRIQRQIKRERIITAKTAIEGELAAIEAMKEQAKIQSEIRKERIQQAIQQLKYEKDILKITQGSMDSDYNLFDENTNKLLKALTKLGEIGLDSKIAEQEELLKLEEIRLIREQMAHDAAIIAAKQDLIDQEIALLEAEKEARLADVAERRQLALLEAAENSRALNAQKDILNSQNALDLLRAAIEKSNQAKTNSDKAAEARALLDALRNNPEALRAEIGEKAFAELQRELDNLSTNINKLEGNLPVEIPTTPFVELQRGVDNLSTNISKLNDKLSDTATPKIGTEQERVGQTPLKESTGMQPHCCKEIVDAISQMSQKLENAIRESRCCKATTEAINQLPQKLTPVVSPATPSNISLPVPAPQPSEPVRVLSNKIPEVISELKNTTTEINQIPSTLQETTTQLVASQDVAQKSVKEVTEQLVTSQTATQEAIKGELSSRLDSKGFTPEIETQKIEKTEALVSELGTTLDKGITSAKDLVTVTQEQEPVIAKFARPIETSAKIFTKEVETSGTSWRESFSNGFSSLGAKVSNIFGGATEKAGKNYVKDAKNASEAFTGGFERLFDNIEKTNSNIKSTARDTEEAGKSWYESISDTASRWTKSVKDTAKELTKKKPEPTQMYFQRPPEWTVETEGKLKDAAEILSDDINDASSRLNSKTNQAAEEIIYSAEEFSDTVNRSANNVSSDLAGAASEASEALTKDITPGVVDAAQAFKEEVSDAGGKLSSLLNGKDGLVGASDDAAYSTVLASEDFATTIVDGAETFVGTVEGAAQSLETAAEQIPTEFNWDDFPDSVVAPALIEGSSSYTSDGSSIGGTPYQSGAAFPSDTGPFSYSSSSRLMRVPMRGPMPTSTPTLSTPPSGMGSDCCEAIVAAIKELGNRLAPIMASAAQSLDNAAQNISNAANKVQSSANNPNINPNTNPNSLEQQIADQKMENLNKQIQGQNLINNAINNNFNLQAELAAQENATADAQIANLEQEKSNIAQTGALERQLGEERIKGIEAAIEQERKKSKLQALQELSNAFVDIGGALTAILIDDKKERLEKAESRHADALADQESALDSLNGVIDNYISQTNKMKEVLEDRRDLEMEMAKVIGAGVSGAKEYYKLQEDYINSVETTISQGLELKDIGSEKTKAEVSLARADLELAASTHELEVATKELDKAQKSLLGRLAKGISTVGKFTNSIIAFLGVIRSVRVAKDNIGIIFSDGFKGLGDLFTEALGVQTKELNKATYRSQAMNSSSREGFLKKYSSLTGGEVTKPGELDSRKMMSTLGTAAAAAFAAYLVKGELDIGQTIGAAAGAAIGNYLTPTIGNVLGSALGGLGNFVAPIIGGAIGAALGSWLGNFFAKTKTSTGTANFATGGISSSGEQSAFVGGVADFGISINNALEQVTNLETGLASLTAVIRTKGSKLKDAYVTAGGYRADFDPEDMATVEKAVFKVIAQSFRDNNSGNKDIRDAVARLDFTADVQRNLEKLEFASKFDDIVTNIELATNNYTDLASYTEDLTRRLAISIDEYTKGAVASFDKLRDQTADVFGENSDQMARLLDTQINYLLEYAGLYQNAEGGIELVEDFTKNINNMSLIIATVTAQTMSFKDALIGAGMSAQEAEDALETGIELKLRKIFDQFEDSLDAALSVGAGIDADIIPKFQEILQYQKDIVADAVVIQETLAGYGNVVAKTEELVYRQRAEMIAEASYVELIALRNLTSAGAEFSNVMVKAGVDAEIARRKIESMFEGIIQMADLMTETSKTMRARTALRFASGGEIPKGSGTPNKDSVPALLMPGEFVINKKAVENVGLEALNAINNQEISKFAGGGSVETTLGTQLMTNAPTSYIGGDLSSIFTLPRQMLSDFQKFGQDTDLVLSFKEASEIINQANYELFDTYRNLLAATGASGGFNDAMQAVYDALKDGDIILAQARFSLATSLIAATTEQEAYNKVIADARANQVLNTAGINKALDGVDGLTSSLNDFYYNAQTSATTYADLSKVTSELNLLLGKEVITSEEYSNALNSVLQAYEDSLVKIQEYTDFFLELQDLDISATGIIQDVREIEYAFLDSTDYILQAVKDGFIDTIDASTAQQRVQTALNRQRIDLLKQASEEELIILKNTNSDIVDVVMKTGAITELVARRLDAVAESYGSFESRMVSVFNSTLEGTERFTKQVVASIESTIKEAGIALDDSTPSVFLGTLATFLQEARNGTVNLADLSTALGELNYQLSVSEEIDTETYKTGVSVLASSFESFSTYANDLNVAFSEAQESLKIFGIEIKAQFKELGASLKSDIENVVNIYKSNFNDLKSVYSAAADNQASAEQELYNSLFAAQQAFSSAGGNLDLHTQKISDIVNGLDPKYMGYAGLVTYLDDLAADIEAGVSELSNIDTGTPLATLQANLASEIANLSKLEALPDSADKFVKISRALSKISSLEEEISEASASAGNKLAEAGLQLVNVEKELNKNNLDADKKNVDLSITELTDDLVLRAQTAREEYNRANEIIDGYNDALANSVNFTAGLTDATVSASLAISDFETSLTNLENDWPIVQTAINDLSSKGLTDALVNIKDQNDQYAISVSNAAQDINEAYTNLSDTLVKYLDVEDTLGMWEGFYGTIIDTADSLPSEEFLELRDNFEAIKDAVTDVSVNIGGTVDTFGEDLQTFLLNAISILESPIKVAPPAVSGLATAIGQAATVASDNLVTTATTGNTYYGTDLTNELLYRILQVLENCCVASGTGTSTATDTISSYSPGSIPNLFDTANLSSLTGQLFSVEEPLSRPADFFYIVVPMIVGPEYFFSVTPGETVWEDWFNIKPDWTWWWQWFEIVQQDINHEEWFNIVIKDTDYYEWFNLILTDMTILQWVNIDTVDVDYRTFFTITQSIITTTELFALSGKQNTDFYYWFEDPTLQATNFYDWFNQIALEEVAYYDFFKLQKLDITFWDWFDSADKIPITELIENTPIDFNDFFYIQTIGSSFDDWFNKTTLTDADYTTFFNLQIKDVNWLDFFNATTVDASDLIVPGNTYNGDEFFDIKPSVIYGTEIYELSDPVLLPGESFVNIDMTKKLQFGVDDVFHAELIGKRALLIEDIFENWNSLDGWDIETKATLNAWDLFDKDHYDNFGLNNKVALKTSDIFTNLQVNDSDIDPQDLGGMPSIEFDDKFTLNVADLFNEPSKVDQNIATWYDNPVLRSTNVWEWFKQPEEGQKASLTEFLEPAPVDELILLLNEPMTVKPRDIFSLTKDPENIVEVTANQLYKISRVDLNFQDVLNVGPYELEAHHVIDFNHLHENKYVAQASDVILIEASDIAGTSLFSPLRSSIKGSSFFNVQPTEVGGGLFFEVTNSSEVDGEDLFTPDPTTLPGAAFFSIGVRKIVDANDLLEIGTPAKIEVTGVFESEFEEHNEKLQTVINKLNSLLLDTAWLSDIADDQHNNAVETANAIYELFAKAQHDLVYSTLQIIADNTDVLPDMAVNIESLPRIEAYLSEYQPYLAELEGHKDTLALVSHYLEQIEQDTTRIVEINNDILYYIKAIYEYMTDTMDVRLANIEASTNNIYTVNNLWLPIIAGPQNVQDPIIGSTVFDLILDELQLHSLYLDNIDVNTNNLFWLQGGVSLSDLLSGDYDITNDGAEGGLAGILKATEDNGDHLKHLSDNLDHLSDNLDHLSNNLDHLSNNLDDVISRLDDLIKINTVRYTYDGYTTTTVAYKTGGLVEGPGTGTSDSIPAKLSKGEFVIKADAVSGIGTDFLEMLNSTGDISTAIASMGIKGDTRLAHINDLEAALLQSLGGSGTKNTRTGLDQYFFDGRPNPKRDDNLFDLLTAYSTNWTSQKGGADRLPEFVYADRASATANYGSYPQTTNINAMFRNLIKSANYVANSDDSYQHKQYGKIGNYRGNAYRNRVNGSTYGNQNGWWEVLFDWDDWHGGSFGAIQTLEPAGIRGDWHYSKGNINAMREQLWDEWNPNWKASMNKPKTMALEEWQASIGLAKGGLLDGAGTSLSDSIYAMLSDGEYVIQNSSVDKVGEDNLHYINRTGKLPQGDTNVEINITNNGQPVDVEAEPTVRLDGDKIVVDVVLKDLRTNGPIKRAIKKVK